MRRAPRSCPEGRDHRRDLGTRLRSRPQRRGGVRGPRCAARSINRSARTRSKPCRAPGTGWWSVASASAWKRAVGSVRVRITLLATLVFAVAFTVGSMLLVNAVHNSLEDGVRADNRLFLSTVADQVAAGAPVTDVLVPNIAAGYQIIDRRGAVVGGSAGLVGEGPLAVVGGQFAGSALPVATAADRRADPRHPPGGYARRRQVHRGRRQPARRRAPQCRRGGAVPEVRHPAVDPAGRRARLARRASGTPAGRGDPRGGRGDLARHVAPASAGVVGGRRGREARGHHERHARPARRIGRTAAGVRVGRVARAAQPARGVTDDARGHRQRRRRCRLGHGCAPICSTRTVGWPDSSTACSSWRVPTTRRPAARRVVEVADVVADEASRRRSIPVDVGEVPHAVVDGHADQLARALRNLLDNAERHATSRMEVTVETVADEVHLVVDDDGPGIPAADREPRVRAVYPARRGEEPRGRRIGARPRHRRRHRRAPRRLRAAPTPAPSAAPASRSRCPEQRLSRVKGCEMERQRYKSLPNQRGVGGCRGAGILRGGELGPADRRTPQRATNSQASWPLSLRFLNCAFT